MTEQQVQEEWVDICHDTKPIINDIEPPVEWKDIEIAGSPRVHGGDVRAKGHIAYKTYSASLYGVRSSPRVLVIHVPTGKLIARKCPMVSTISNDEVEAFLNRYVDGFGRSSYCYATAEGLINSKILVEEIKND